jgi:hypothetical protein
LRTVRAPMVAMSTPVDLDSLPMQPTPELSAPEVVEVICRGLQHNDYPEPDAGIVRLYNFMTPQGRVSLAPPGEAARSHARASVV